MEEIIQEKISADHLLYVSLKYTKTCDVILNLLLRWRKMIETAIDEILKHAKKKKKISSVSPNNVGRIEQIQKLFRKNEEFLEVIELYEMLRKIEELKGFTAHKDIDISGEVSRLEEKLDQIKKDKVIKPLPVDYLTILKTANVLGIARATVARLIADGRLYSMKQPFYRRGGKKRIPCAEVESLG